MTTSIKAKLKLSGGKTNIEKHRIMETKSCISMEILLWDYDPIIKVLQEFMGKEESIKLLAPKVITNYLSNFIILYYI